MGRELSDLTPVETIVALYNLCVAETVAGGLLNGVSVVNGPVTKRTAQKKRLFIGTSSDGLSAEGDNPESSLPGVVDTENFAILCVAESSADTLSNVRTIVFDIRGAVRQLLRPAPSGLVLGVSSLASARIGSWTLEQMQTESGPYAGITFRVECNSKPSVN